MNGGPKFKFTETISLFVSRDTQEEIDDLWEKLSAGGWKDRCGWLKYKFGLSWQIVPAGLLNPAKADRAMRAMMQMASILPVEKLQPVRFSSSGTIPRS